LRSYLFFNLCTLRIHHNNTKMVRYQIAFSILLSFFSILATTMYLLTIETPVESNDTSSFLLETSSILLENSTKLVLKPNIQIIAAPYFDSNSMQNTILFPPIGIVRDNEFECKSYPWDKQMSQWGSFVSTYLSHTNKQRKGEFLQEVGFIEFFQHHYPRSFMVNSTGLKTKKSINKKEPSVVSIEHLNSILPIPRVFFPFCGFFEKDGNFGKQPLWKSSDVISQIQKEVLRKQMFYVSPHPGTVISEWEHLSHNMRTLQIDQTVRGSYNDIIIPVSTTPLVCDYNYAKERHLKKENLLYSCGSEHSKRYKGLRSDIPDLFNLIKKPGIDMLEGNRSVKNYEEGFWKSKYCLIIPGDTTGTSQTTRAMCAGCVPIFITSDFRDLPFSNILAYNRFSIRYHSWELTPRNITSESGGIDLSGAINMYNSLQEMISNGTYAELRHHVEIARDFFNYHKFGSRSPYGAALVSMFQDDLDEYK